MWVTVAIATALLISSIRYLYFWRSGRCLSKVKLHGKTVIVTGSSAGIGEYTARDLAKRGARVIMACRNRAKAQKVADDIIKTTGNNQVFVKELDLSSLSSVRKFAKEILDTEPSLHILINNAGIAGSTKRKVTPDGLELTMATNYFGHFLLTNMLLGLLKDSAPSRIINVASAIHFALKSLNISDLNYEKRPYPFLGTYGDSKLCNVLFNHELARKLTGTGVTANSLHPGAVNSELVDKAERNPISYFFMLFFWLFAKDCNLGAQTNIYLAVAEEVANVSGKYFVDCEISETSVLAQDQELARDLWEASEKLVHLTEEEKHY